MNQGKPARPVAPTLPHLPVSASLHDMKHVCMDGCVCVCAGGVGNGRTGLKEDWRTCICICIMYGRAALQAACTWFSSPEGIPRYPVDPSHLKFGYSERHRDEEDGRLPGQPLCKK